MTVKFDVITSRSKWVRCSAIWTGSDCDRVRCKQRPYKVSQTESHVKTQCRAIAKFNVQQRPYKVSQTESHVKTQCRAMAKFNVQQRPYKVSQTVTCKDAVQGYGKVQCTATAIQSESDRVTCKDAVQSYGNVQCTATAIQSESDRVTCNDAVQG